MLILKGQRESHQPSCPHGPFPSGSLAFTALFPYSLQPIASQLHLLRLLSLKAGSSHSIVPSPTHSSQPGPLMAMSSHSLLPRPVSFQSCPVKPLLLIVQSPNSSIPKPFICIPKLSTHPTRPLPQRAPSRTGSVYNTVGCGFPPSLIPKHHHRSALSPGLRSTPASCTSRYPLSPVPSLCPTPVLSCLDSSGLASSQSFLAARAQAQ